MPENLSAVPSVVPTATIVHVSAGLSVHVPACDTEPISVQTHVAPAAEIVHENEASAVAAALSVTRTLNVLPAAVVGVPAKHPAALNVRPAGKLPVMAVV